MITWEEACVEKCKKLAELLVKKQKDYGHGNINDFGELGILVRANDKIARLKNLQNKGAVNESKSDSWWDLAGYSILALMLEDGSFNNELKE